MGNNDCTRKVAINSNEPMKRKRGRPPSKGVSKDQVLPVKRKRGRPPATQVGGGSGSENEWKPYLIKRKRGRPSAKEKWLQQSNKTTAGSDSSLIEPKKESDSPDENKTDSLNRESLSWKQSEDHPVFENIIKPNKTDSDQEELESSAAYSAANLAEFENRKPIQGKIFRGPGKKTTPKKIKPEKKVKQPPLFHPELDTETGQYFCPAREGCKFMSEKE